MMIHHGLVGAWFLKCDAVNVWDYNAAMAAENIPARVSRPGAWTVRETYRLWEMRAGDKFVLRVSDSTGWWIREIGRLRLPGPNDGTAISGPISEGTIDSVFLIDQSRANELTPLACYDSAILKRPVGRGTFLSDSVLSASEPVNAPQMSNPSYLSHAELAALERRIHPDDRRAAGWL